MDKPRVLIVDDDRIILDSLSEFLTIEGYETVSADSYKSAVGELKKFTFSLVLTDVNLPDGGGMELLEYVKGRYPQTVVIIITGYGTIESAVEFIKKGAYEYLTKPVVDDELLLAVERAIKQHNLMNENKSLRSQLERKYSLENIVSQDYKMARIFELVECIADSSSTILMTGASGTGKSMLARAIHYRSYRRDNPFVEVSCGALPETLLESELFGHTKGAFTGAVGDKKGKFLAADGGTLFLDEISSASPAMQVKLLRVLQDRQFEPVGSNKTYTVNTRVILATNKDLAEEVKRGRFREDLYYRINVVAIKLPALCERVSDIPVLANHFLEVFCERQCRSKDGFSDDAIELMQRYGWPGNVRELENVVERAVLLSKGRMIGVEDLPAAITEDSYNPLVDDYSGQSLKKALEGPERHIIRKALEGNGWNRQRTAQALQINRTTLYKKMKRYGLDDDSGYRGE
jgi:DNA-binding NtrC family response regulator